MNQDRYARQIGLPEIGPEGQEKLRKARVLLVGVGGLGAPISLYLAGAGIGCLGIVDDDVVSASNLHRQVLYSESQVGAPKVECAAERLQALNPEIEVKPYAVRLAEDNAEAILKDYDLVVDGCDNYATRYVIDDAARKLGKPYVYGAVSGYEGQVSVFGVGESPLHYRDLYPVSPQSPADKSVVGMSPAVVGGVMAHEVLKLVCGYGQLLSHRIWSVNLLTMDTFTLEF